MPSKYALASLVALTAQLALCQDVGYELVARLHPDKCSSSTNEPCYVRVSVTNECPETVQLTKMFDPVLNVGVEVVRKDRRPTKHPKTTTLLYDFEDSSAPRNTTYLRPGESLDVRLDLRLTFNLAEKAVYVVRFRTTKSELYGTSLSGKRAPLAKAKDWLEVEMKSEGAPPPDRELPASRAEAKK